ncbi:MAG: site-specific integrase [Actinobacteria bacterium]|nr:site-specific integrase [Actinomycetota bacterium]
MAGRSREVLSGPLEPFVVGFAAELSQQGFKPVPVVQQLELVADLDRWLAAEGVGLAGLSSEVAERFCEARRAAGCTSRVTVRALGPLLGYLRGLGVAPPASTPAPAGAVEELLSRFRRYLEQERGLVPAAARGYVDKVRPFLERFDGPDGLELERVGVVEVRGFVVDACPRLGRRAAELTVVALRSLLRFLHLDGELERSLAGAVPSVAGWRLSGLPKRLEPGQVAALLASCDRSTVAGVRDLAILTVLARLGLRAGEVAGLSLEDVDWRAGEIVVCGKGERSERLPLPVDVGEAIVGYLRDGRPVSAQGRTLFLRVVAPHCALTTGGVTQVVVAAARRAGLGQIHAHRLRHTAASEMLRAGATLPEVGQVLRHRRAASTAIYAKVDREALRTIARPWPGATR